MLVRTLLALLPFLMLADGEPTGDEEDADTDATADRDDADGTTAEESLGDKGREALRREREARKVAEKERTDLQKRIADFEKRQREADETKAKEEGDYKRLLEEREKELAELRDTLTSRDRDDLRTSIARKHNLPEDAVKYLSGDDEDSIEASAKELAKLTARSEDVDTDSGKRTSTTKTTKKPESLLASYKFGQRR